MTISLNEILAKAETMSAAKTSVSLDFNGDKVEISGPAARVTEILEDHLAADQMRRKRGQREAVQALILFGGRWHLADHVGSFIFWPVEAKRLYKGDLTKLAGYEVQADGRVIAKAWCRHDLSLICLVGGEERLADLP